MRPELSDRNPLKLSKHRYYELQHWCLQYPEWKYRLQVLEPYAQIKLQKSSQKFKMAASNPTETLALERAQLQTNMDLLKRTAHNASEELYAWLFRVVTGGYSFTQLKMQYDIPCERDMFYEKRRLFFWLLDKEKGP